MTGAPKKKAKPKKPTCRCSASPAAKKQAAAKKTAAKVARKTPRAAKAIKKIAHNSGAGKLHAAVNKIAKQHAKTPVKKAGGGGKLASSAPAKHTKAETHCQCNKTSAPKPRGTTPRH